MNEAKVDFLCKYYEIHVGHRRMMLNFLLIITPVLISAISLLVINDKKLEPFLISIYGGLSSYGFYRLDKLILRKIKEIEGKIASAFGYDVFPSRVGGFFDSDGKVCHFIEWVTIIIFGFLILISCWDLFGNSVLWYLFSLIQIYLSGSTL